jgi:predicted GIY-YIG superfamily endonuclease
MHWYVYWLQDDKSNKTYIGKTNDLDRRLRQHNGEISGGAFATHGSHWHRVCHVAGFPDERGALQFEWAWKHYSRRLPIKDSFQRRVQALHALLSAEAVYTSKFKTEYKYVYQPIFAAPLCREIIDYFICK